MTKNKSASDGRQCQMALAARADALTWMGLLTQFCVDDVDTLLNDPPGRLWRAVTHG